ncbi:unnamed protein product [Durusdinium trenchii]|uniref:Uncharacterized protein n=1 Tax=Durusdinium trenchii TaxID=1381693 RepID=A0ABP0PPD9_9DINO
MDNPRDRGFQLLVAAEEEDDASRDAALRFWKLDAMRAHFSEEFLIGILVDLGLEELSAGGNLFELLQSLWLMWQASAVIVALYIKNWWLLGFGVGGAFCLLERDVRVDRPWENCINDYLPLAYSVNQRFAQCLGPIVALWFVLTSRALDRLYEIVSPSADIKDSCNYKASWKTWRNGMLYAILGRDVEHEGALGFFMRYKLPRVLKLAVRREHGDESTYPTLLLNFYKGHHSMKVGAQQEGGQQHSDSEDSDPEKGWEKEPDLAPFIEDDDSIRGEDVAVVVEAELMGDTVALIYSSQGHHLVTKLKRNNDNTITFTVDSKGQYKRIDEALGSRAILLLVFGRGADNRRKRPRKPILLETTASSYKRGSQHLDASKKREKECFRKSCVVPTVFLQAAGPVLILLVLILVNPWGIGGYGSIMLLILPDLAEVFLYNQTHQRDDPMTVGNETTLSREQEVMSRWQQGWECVSNHNSFLARLALWESTFFLGGCTLILLVCCWHLKVADQSLAALTDLLHISQRRDKRSQAILLYRLHEIRAKISNKRCLEFHAENALPDRLEPDPSFAWWFETRAAVFSDINLNLKKRKPIIFLCFAGELVLIVLTMLASFYHEEDFVLTCYAAVYGIGLGIFMLIFIFLGSQVNWKLQSGVEKLQKLTEQPPVGSPESSPLRAKGPDQANPSRTPEHVPRTPAAELSVRNQFLRYEEEHPSRLQFLGFSFSMNYFSAFAAPLATMAGTVGFGILQHTLKPYLKSLS